MKEYGVGIVTAAHFILCYCGMREANGEGKEGTPSARTAESPEVPFKSADTVCQRCGAIGGVAPLRSHFQKISSSTALTGAETRLGGEAVETPEKVHH